MTPGMACFEEHLVDDVFDINVKYSKARDCLQIAIDKSCEYIEYDKVS